MPPPRPGSHRGPTPDRTDDRPRIGISACLLGDQVRFDGGHKRDPFLTDVLAAHVQFVRVCPEVEVGMGTPRETLRLVRAEDATVRMVTTRTGIDHTGAMVAWSKSRLSELDRANLSGYILKKDSPSCGMERVKVFGESGMPERNGRGIFAAALLPRFPNLPVEEEGRLLDPRLRENFIERVFAYQRLQRCFIGRWSVGGLVQFHTAHEMSVLSHSTTRYRELGQLVASAATMPRAALRADYESRFMKTMALVATVRRHTNVLMHMAGHLETLLDAASKQELLACIDEYRRELVPLVVPLTLLRHHVRTHQVGYLLGQTYLEPHPWANPKIQATKSQPIPNPNHAQVPTKPSSPSSEGGWELDVESSLGFGSWEWLGFGAWILGFATALAGLRLCSALPTPWP